MSHLFTHSSYCIYDVLVLAYDYYQLWTSKIASLSQFYKNVIKKIIRSDKPNLRSRNRKATFLKWLMNFTQISCLTGKLKILSAIFSGPTFNILKLLIIFNEVVWIKNF